MSVRRETLERIAIGGLAEILLARERGPAGVSRLVVVKRLRPDLADNPELAEMLADEARVLALLEHPNIVRLYAATFDETPELILEFLDGPDLHAINKKTQGSIETSDAIDIGLGIAEGLELAHTRQDARGRPLSIVHRDITPRNVIVTSAGVVKLIDFGIAKARSNVYETATGVVRGTPRYMAPEQVAGGRQDARVDIYALGVLLYELIAGEHPLGTTMGVALHDAVMEHGIPYLAKTRPDCDHKLADLIYHCTRIDPDERPPTMSDVVAALASIRVKYPAPRIYAQLRSLVQFVRS